MVEHKVLEGVKKFAPQAGYLFYQNIIVFLSYCPSASFAYEKY